MQPPIFEFLHRQISLSTIMATAVSRICPNYIIAHTYDVSDTHFIV